MKVPLIVCSLEDIRAQKVRLSSLRLRETETQYKKGLLDYWLGKKRHMLLWIEKIKMSLEIRSKLKVISIDVLNYLGEHE